MTAQPTRSGNVQPHFKPADACSRRIIEEDLDATLFVEASAGTGKTTSLVKRVVNLVATGRTTLKKIAAITFTEAAASELRDRVRQGLVDCVRGRVPMPWSNAQACVKGNRRSGPGRHTDAAFIRRDPAPRKAAGSEAAPWFRNDR